LHALGTRLAWLTFYPAVAIAALNGGLAAGVLAIVLSCITVSFVLPAFAGGPLIRDFADGLGMSVFIVTCVLIAVIAERMLQANERASRATREAEAANRELEAFSYSVAHDLRAPLRSIDGFSQAILEDSGDKLDADGKHHLERVRTAAQRMALLIDDLLALSRVSRAELHRGKVDLTRLAETVGARLRHAHAAREVDLSVQQDVVVVGDANLLEVVMDNLLGNAWKFTGKRPHAHVEVGATVEDGRPVYFVRDDGAGFDMAYAGKLFGAFQRLHSAGEFPGTGIGLATVQRIVHRHGGRVWAKSVPDRGTTVHFTLG
jgi:signal transduction histidine kinase